MASVGSWVFGGWPGHRWHVPGFSVRRECDAEVGLEKRQSESVVQDVPLQRLHGGAPGRVTGGSPGLLPPSACYGPGLGALITAFDDLRKLGIHHQHLRYAALVQRGMPPYVGTVTEVQGLMSALRASPEPGPGAPLDFSQPAP